MDTRKRCLSAGDNVDLLDSQDSGNDLGLPFKVVLRKGKKSKTDKPTITQSQPTPSEVITKVVRPSVHQLEKCVYCDKNCEFINSMQCKSCLHFYHLSCFGVDPDILGPSAFVVGNLLGWACDACRLESTETIRRLRTDLNLVSTTLDFIKAKLGLSGEESNLPSPSIATTSTHGTIGSSTIPSTFSSADADARPTVAPTLNNGTSSAGLVTVQNSEPPMTRSSLASVVLGTIRDVDRRRKNVVITGLPESRLVTEDVKAVADLLASHVRCPYVPEILSCGRLGKTSNPTRHRKVLVRFSSEKDATSVLNYAKSLRISSDRYIADNVYINADLSKDEAKMAYDKRVSRRNTVRGQMGGVEEGNGTGAAATAAVGSANFKELRATADIFQPGTSHSIQVITDRRPRGVVIDATTSPSINSHQIVNADVLLVNVSAVDIAPSLANISVVDNNALAADPNSSM